MSKPTTPWSEFVKQYPDHYVTYEALNNWVAATEKRFKRAERCIVALDKAFSVIEKAVKPKVRYKGEWVEGREYGVDDAVTRNGRLFRCKAWYVFEPPLPGAVLWDVLDTPAPESSLSSEDSELVTEEDQS